MATSYAEADWPTLGGSQSRNGLNNEFSNYDVIETAELWNFTAGGRIYSSPAVSDINDDGILDVVFGSDDGNLYALDYKGNFLWNYQTGGLVKSAPTVAKLYGNKSYIIFGSDDGNLYTLYGNGSLLWKFKAGGMVRSSPLVANVDETPDLEIIFGDMKGNFYRLGPDGRLKWSYYLGGPVESSAAAVDFDSDGKLEYTVGSNNAVLYVFKTIPARVWMLQGDGDFSQTPAIDQTRGILIGSDSEVLYRVAYSTLDSATGSRVCSGATCKIESIPVSGIRETWTYNLTKKVTSAAAVGNFNSMPGDEIVFAADNWLYAMNSTGSKIFIYTVGKTIRSSPILADFNADGLLEIIFGSGEGRIYMLNSNGTTDWYRELDGSVEASPAVADLTGDGSLEFFVGTEGGTLYAFGSERRSTMDEAHIYYSKALSYFNQSNYNKSVEYAGKASEIYASVNYSDGVKLCNNIMDMVNADNQYAEAVDYYNKGKLKLAVDILTNVSTVCYNVEYEECYDRANQFMKRIDADTYLLEAKYYYQLGDFENSSKYATTAKTIYSSIGNFKGSDDADTLMNSSVKHKLADAEYDKGLEAYSASKFDVASKHLSYALSIYTEINSTSGIEKAGLIVNRLKADEVYTLAQNYYTAEDYKKAAEYAKKASELYNSANLSSGTATADTLVNKSLDAVMGVDDYNYAAKYFGATDYRSAMDYALSSMDHFNKSGNSKGYTTAEALYNKSSERIKLMESGSSGEGITEETMLYGVILVLLILLVWLIFGRKKLPVFLYGEKFYGKSVKKQCQGSGRGLILVPKRK
ncbi:MAG: PQQ-binding-like beta-propeller repeat protein [Candidatus Altiarchaeota archaeon]|nr:PQQ-binding-like beta-propeller repeat protein [Candidatus Altiarchaeota archaeon]